MTRSIILAASLAAAPFLAPLPARAQDGSSAPADVASDSSAQFAALLDEAWEFELAEDPLFATYYGDRRYNDRLPKVSLADATRRIAAKRGYLERLENIDRAKLSRTDQINYDIFGRSLRNDLGEANFNAHLVPITNRSGFHVSFPEMHKNVPLETVEDYDNYVARLQGFRLYADGHIELLREGVKQGVTLPAVVLRDFETPIKTHIVDEATHSLLYEPFRELPDDFSATDKERLRSAAAEAIKSSVVPGYQAFLEFMRDEYVPHARGQEGASALPNGREFYRHRVRRFTTMDLTPEEVHEIGLAEVARIKAEMEDVIRESGFEGDFSQFVEFLRTDPRFYVDTPEQLMKEVAVVLKKMDGQLPTLFGKLPRTPYGIREVPPYIAPGTTTAYYQPPAGDGSLAGFYYVNTYDLKSRPLYEIEALSLHEAVPGHHLQIALQQELEGLPPFRRFADVTAFIEGWGLYSERLGLETGFYEDPYSNFGRLSYEMWRACRLVVDTGIHYLGWTRQQAIDFMLANTALTERNVTAEVDRYIAWPGQAVAYKTGELKIRSLRKLAEDKLGDRFDVREFHDVVLGSGAVPLDVLEENVEAYIEAASQMPDGPVSASK